MSTNSTDTLQVPGGSKSAAAPSSAAGQSVNKRCAPAPPRFRTRPFALGGRPLPRAAREAGGGGRARGAAAPGRWELVGPLLPPPDAPPVRLCRACMQAAIRAHVAHDEHGQRPVRLPRRRQHLPVDGDDHGRGGNGARPRPARPRPARPRPRSLTGGRALRERLAAPLAAHPRAAPRIPSPRRPSALAACRLRLPAVARLHLAPPASPSPVRAPSRRCTRA